MTNTPNVLVLAGTGKTGARVARQLAEAGLDARPVARSGTNTRFDWNSPSTFRDALAGIDRVYLVPPGNSLDFAPQVGEFLEQAENVGVSHVTFLSARGIEAAPAEVALRAVELDLASRTKFGHSILRPAWFMQDFTESFLLPGILEQHAVIAPCGDGAEAFIDAEDIAAVAVASLTDPNSHDGHAYTLTGPSALSMSDAAAVITAFTGRTITHVDIDRDQWMAATIAAGVPADYAAMLGSLFDVIRSGAGATTTDDFSSVTHRAPTNFSDFAEGNRQSWNI